MSENLPSPCAQCTPFSGAWVLTESGMKRCACERGQMLQRLARQKNISQPPVITDDEAKVLVQILTSLPFFPPEPAARGMIGQEICAMCRSLEDGSWLVRRMLQIYDAWPGLREMRILYQTRAHPLDAIVVHADSSVYPDGIPAQQEPDLPTLPSTQPLALPPGHQVSVSPSIEATVCDLADAKDMCRLGPAKRVRDIPILPPHAKPITEADITRTVQELHNRQARRELGLEDGI